ncbi:DUF1353 domain-containing protein [Spirosoma oryzicola]|uniref:DUF1353 domain-containing protein n=1 Tax=Spirosoma oryzicola TaxID=2898794 RepID=UPI001E38A62A|nr:DUF1353 domain-containing protein [Spirosoma oryzicola]UHG90119.1 DUF1353 domain-containing protein [Spirosoma oryzicola]
MSQQPIVVRYKEDDPKADRWVLVQSVTFMTKAGKVTVPRGYTTDFASVPMLLWGFFPPIGRHNRATLLHDWWYDNRLFEEVVGQRQARRLADEQLYEQLKAVEPRKPIRNYCMYLACRWFGHRWWVN